MSLTMILTNHNRLGTDWHLDASIRSVCSINFNNLFHHFPGCGELPQYGVSDDDYGPLPPPSPSLTPEIKAIVGELLVSIKERVIGHPTHCSAADTTSEPPDKFSTYDATQLLLTLNRRQFSY